MTPLFPSADREKEEAMATRPQIDRLFIPPPSDPIRIVPLHIPEAIAGAAPAAAPGPAPQLTYRNGPLITAAEVFTIFWGASWNPAPQIRLVQKINQFFDFILTSPLMDQLTEYNVSGQSIGHGRRTGSATITARS